MTINVANRNPVARIDDKSDDFGKLAAWITENLGGPVDKIVRQRRWRPVWRATYQDNGAPTDLLCKGTREWSAHPYPLEYEMRMMQVLEDNGIRVPHVHGMFPGIGRAACRGKGCSAG